MPAYLKELQYRLNPIIEFGISSRETELNHAVRAVTDEALKHGAYKGSRMALALEEVYRAELSKRAELVWGAIKQFLDVWETKDASELNDSLKHFLNEWLTVFRLDLSSKLRNGVGPTALGNKQLSERFELNDLHEALLRSYGSQVDLLTTQIDAKNKKQARDRRSALFWKIMDWSWRLVGRVIGK